MLIPNRRVLLMKMVFKIASSPADMLLNQLKNKMMLFIVVALFDLYNEKRRGKLRIILFLFVVTLCLEIDLIL